MTQRFATRRSVARRSVARRWLARPARLLAGFVAVAAVLVAWSCRAWAPAELTDTEPAAGAQTTVPPEQVVLRFTEGVDAVPGGMRLVRAGAADAVGDEVTVSVGRVDGDDTTIRLAPNGALSDGTYVVSWRVISADSHPVRGAFTFRVGEAADVDASALINRLLTQSGGGSGAGVLLAIGRWLSYAAVLLLVGWLSIAALAAVTGRGRAADGSGAARTPSPGGAPPPSSARHVATVAVAGAVGTAVMLAGQAVSLRGSGSAIVSVGAYGDVIATRAGLLWLIRLGALVACAIGARVLPASRRAVPAGPAAVALLVVTTLGGHGTSGRWPLLGAVATAVHLVAVGFWLAGLVSLGLLLAHHGGASPERSQPEGLLAAAAWFSPWALIAVVALAASGLVNGVRQVGQLGLLISTDYGRLLLAKVVVVAVAVGVASLSRRLVQLHAAEVVGPDGGARRLRRTVRVELGLSALALVLTALLVNQAPAISERTSIATANAVAGERIAQIVLDPARTGGTAMHVYLTSSRGSLDRAQEIRVTATLAERDIGPLELPVFPAGPNHVTNPDLDLPLPGTWTFSVIARYGEFEEVTFTAALTVRH